MERAIVVGVEGGGSHTRALCCALDGRVLAYAETGGSNPSHANDAAEQVAAAINAVVEHAGHTLADVVGLVAGLAGLNEPADQVWAEQFTALPDLVCPRLHVNDAVIAHRGAFGVGPGIIAVAGTGGTIYGVTDRGRTIRDDDFGYYAPAAARFLARDTIFAILAGEAEATDAAFVQRVLGYWRVTTIDELRLVASEFARRDYQAHKRALGGLAPLITASALEGTPLPRRMCDRAAEVLCRGIRLLGNLWQERMVGVVPIGGVARSAYVKRRLAEALARSPEKHYQLVEPRLSPIAGAVLLAFEQHGIIATESILARLQADSHAAFGG